MSKPPAKPPKLPPPCKGYHIRVVGFCPECAIDLKPETGDPSIDHYDDLGPTVPGVPGIPSQCPVRYKYLRCVWFEGHPAGMHNFGGVGPFTPSADRVPGGVPDPNPWPSTPVGFGDPDSYTNNDPATEVDFCPWCGLCLAVVGLQPCARGTDGLHYWPTREAPGPHAPSLTINLGSTPPGRR